MSLANENRDLLSRASPIHTPGRLHLERDSEHAVKPLQPMLVPGLCIADANGAITISDGPESAPVGGGWAGGTGNIGLADGLT